MFELLPGHCGQAHQHDIVRNFLWRNHFAELGPLVGKDLVHGRHHLSRAVQLALHYATHHIKHADHRCLRHTLQVIEVCSVACELAEEAAIKRLKRTKCNLLAALEVVFF